MSFERIVGTLTPVLVHRNPLREPKMGEAFTGRVQYTVSFIGDPVPGVEFRQVVSPQPEADTPIIVSR